MEQIMLGISLSLNNIDGTGSHNTTGTLIYHGVTAPQSRLWTITGTTVHEYAFNVYMVDTTTCTVIDTNDVVLNGLLDLSSDLTALTRLDFSNGIGLTYADISGADDSLTNINFFNNSLPNAGVGGIEAIAANLVSFGATSGTLDVSGGNNEIITNTALSSLTQLLTNGFTSVKANQPAPTNLLVDASSGFAVLSWMAAPSLSAIQFIINKNGGPYDVSGTSPYTDPTPAIAGNFYTVQGDYGLTNYGYKSNEVIVPEEVVGLAFTNFQANPTPLSVTFTWTSPYDHWNIFKNGTLYDVAVNSNIYTDTNSLATTDTYNVVAIDGDGNIGIPTIAAPVSYIQTDSPTLTDSSGLVNFGGITITGGSGIYVTGSIDPGDGSGSQSCTFSGTHPTFTWFYGANGSYTWSINITDNFGNTLIDSTGGVTVSNLGLQLFTGTANPHVNTWPGIGGGTVYQGQNLQINNVYCDTPSAITAINASTTALAGTFDFSNVSWAVALQQIEIGNCLGVTAVDISGATLLNDVNVSYNHIDTAGLGGIDDILQNLVNNGVTNGTCSLQGPNNGNPSNPGGITNVLALEALGWTVNIN